MKEIRMKEIRMKEIGRAGLMPFTDFEKGTGHKIISFGYRLRGSLLPGCRQIFDITVVQVLDMEGFENSLSQSENGKIEYAHDLRYFKGKNVPDEFQFQIDVEYQFNQLRE